MSNKGKIIQVMGPVVDVAFEDENLPAIRERHLPAKNTRLADITFK